MRATAIRDAILSKLDALKIGASTSRIGIFPVQLGALPHLRVFVASEAAVPDGDGNAGAPSLVFDSTIAIGVTRRGDDDDEVAAQLDVDADKIISGLLTDPEFVRLHPSGLFESLERMTRKIVPQRDGETILAELQIELTFRHRRDYEPVIPGEFHAYTATLRGVQTPGGQPMRVDYDLRQD